MHAWSAASPVPRGRATLQKQGRTRLHHKRITTDHQRRVRVNLKAPDCTLLPDTNNVSTAAARYDNKQARAH